eukprot:11156890-Lingulodinium_polyedra.AAC.1
MPRVVVPRHVQFVVVEAPAVRCYCCGSCCGRRSFAGPPPPGPGRLAGAAYSASVQGGSARQQL